MHKAVLIGLASAGITLTSTAAATFDDIQFWVGSGVHQAALVIDWNDGKADESLLWGYRWDGTATGLDMFEAVVSADSRLFAYLGQYAWGTAILGIGYDLNENQVFGVSPVIPFDSSGWTLDASPAPDDSREPVDSADHYLEGWNNGFWGYNVRSTGDDPWAGASTGASDRVLGDGAWDGYSFAPGFAFSDPSEPVAVTPVPEPASLSLVWIGGGLLACARRRRS